MTAEPLKCTRCKDKGYIEYYDIDGCTIYRWQKPKRQRCTCESRNKIVYCDS